MTHRCFVVHQGYVEDESVACVTLMHDDGFDTPEAAMNALREVLLILAAAYVSQPKQCCALTFEANPKARFCMHCGFDRERATTAEHYVQRAWQDIWTGNNDSLGIDFFDVFKGAGWSFRWPDGPFITINRIEEYLDWEDGEPTCRLIWCHSNE